MPRRRARAEPERYRLLVVDFDYFFPTPEAPGLHFDWGHMETRFHIGPVWQIRAAGLQAAGIALPLVNDEWRTFWQRFRIAPDARLYWSESNAYAAHVAVTTPGIPGEVWLYDAHHDSGYQGQDPLAVTMGERYSCENWMIYYAAYQRPIQVSYPRWKHWWKRDFNVASLKGWPNWHAGMDTGASPLTVFDRIFVCRSGAWVPPWCDQAFEEFLRLCPATGMRLCLDGELPPREWDQANVDRMAASMLADRELMLAGRAVQ